jgi:DNA-binding HxlR family transcriptional regulator
MVARQSALARTRENIPRQPKGPEGVLKTPESLPDLDRLIHERIRLGIISALAANSTSSLSFNDLKRLLKTTDGNLSVHARKLEDAGYIACAKTFEGRMPKTEYALTAAGRKALEKYLNHMEALIHAMRTPDAAAAGSSKER